MDSGEDSSAEDSRVDSESLRNFSKVFWKDSVVGFRLGSSMEDLLWKILGGILLILIRI